MRRPATVPHQWPLLAVLLAGIIAIAALWFAVAQPLGQDQPEDGGRYLEGLAGRPQRINPLFANLNDVDRDIARLVFSGLTRLGPNGEILPDLAQAWDISPDGRLYTFRLRPDVTWHDGAPFTATDVLFTYALLADPQFPGDPQLGQFWQQAQCLGLDPFTVRCQLPAPFAPFLSFLTIGILPQHSLQDVEAQDLLNHPFNLNPVGSGPFRLTRIDETRALLKRHPAYHLGVPKMQEIELRFYPDQHAALTALHRNDIQGLLLSTAIGRDDLQALLSRDDLRLYSANGTAYTILYLNHRSPPFSNPLLREAIALAIDRDAIVEGFLDGRALRADSPIAPGTWAYNPRLEPIVHDPAKARQLLDKAGWLQTDPDSPRRKGSQTLRFPILTDTDPLRTAIAREAARQLRTVGIEASVRSLGASDLLQESLLPRNYQAAIFGWDSGYDPDPYPAWHSSQASSQGHNLANYVSIEADRIMETARKTADPSQRQTLYHDFQRIFLADIASLPLYYPIYNYFVHESVRGIGLGTLFDTATRFANIQDWTLQAQAELVGS